MSRDGNESDYAEEVPIFANIAVDVKRQKTRPQPIGGPALARLNERFRISGCNGYCGMQAYLAATLNAEGHYAEAEKLARKTYETEIRIHGLEYLDTVNALRQLGKALARTNRYAEASTLATTPSSSKSSPHSNSGWPKIKRLKMIAVWVLDPRGCCLEMICAGTAWKERNGDPERTRKRNTWLVLEKLLLRRLWPPLLASARRAGIWNSVSPKLPQFNQSLGSTLRIPIKNRKARLGRHYVGLQAESHHSFSRVNVATKLGSHVLPPSSENACSKW